MAMSYSAVLSSSTPSSRSHDGSNGSNEDQDRTTPKKVKSPTHTESHPPRKSSPSPSQQPKTVTEGENLYILTISTTKDHHQRMTELRKKYFPRKIYKVGAHITLFHALPEGRLESSIIPVIKNVCSRTSQFYIIAQHPQKLGKHGIGVFLDNPGSREIQHVHSRLLQSFHEGGWLSQQDSGGMKPHYTIMNKVEDEPEVDSAFEEIKKDFEPDHGTAEGLGLWRYDRGWWRSVQRLPFTGKYSAQDDNVNR